MKYAFKAYHSTQSVRAGKWQLIQSKRRLFDACARLFHAHTPVQKSQFFAIMNSAKILYT